jgi:tight adherence protein B
MDSILIGSLLATIAFFFLFVGVTLVIRGSSFEIAVRLDQLSVFRLPRLAAAPTGPKRTSPGRVSRFLSAGTGPDLATELARADMKLTPAEFVFLTLLSTLVGFVLALLIFRGNLLFALGGALLGIFVPRWVMRFLQRKRLHAFDAQLGDTVVLLSNSLRSGYSLLQSMETVTKELGPPVATEFSRVTREVGLGLTLEEALSNLMRRVPSDDLDFMVTAINIQREVGGNLAQILDVIAETIRERIRIMGEIRSITAQQRLSALVLSLLPMGLGLALFALNPEYVSQLWHYNCGIVMLIVGGCLIVLGYLVIRRIASIEV